MQLDETTLTILKNFQTINSAIQIKEGNVITTKSTVGNVLARAVVHVEFPKTFCIYELKRFLSVISTFKNAEIEFSDSYLTFVEGNKRLRYTYCDPEMIVVPMKEPGSFPAQDVFFEFTLTADMLKEALVGMSVLGHDGVVFKGVDGKLMITTASEVNADSFMMEIGETDETFNFIFEASKLNIIPKDYKVTLSRKRHMHLETDNLAYWISANKNSTVD